MGPGFTTRRVKRSKRSKRRFPCSSFFTFSSSALICPAGVTSLLVALSTTGANAANIAARARVSSW
jgi:hypothetical protein